MIVYKEIEIVEHPILAELDMMREWVKKSDAPTFISGNPDTKFLDAEQLQKIKDGSSINNAYHRRFNYLEGFDYSNIETYIKQIYEEQVGTSNYLFVRVAKTWYPKNGYLGWHIDNDGGRLYATWAEGKSFFRYQDPLSKEIITSWDKPKEWTFRIFTFNSESPLWHCVGAEDMRISIGYRFVHK